RLSPLRSLLFFRALFMSTLSTTSPTHSHRLTRLGLGSATLALLAGCATVSQPNPDDPLESYNRTMYKINYNVDQALVKPIANTYKTLTPKPARTCVSNVFNNLGDAWSAVNSFLQGRPHDFFNTFGRVLFNSTMGLGGCFDVAS